MGTLAGYDYYVDISIPSSSDGELTNHQVKFTLVKSTGSNSGRTIYLNDEGGNWPYDVRFTASDGTTLLDFYREEYDATDGTWWVEVPTIPASGGITIRLYTGKADATDVSDGDATFRGGDDFPGSSIDTDKWTVTNNVSVGSGYATVYRTTGILTSSSIVSKTSFASPARVIMAVYANPDGSSRDAAWRAGLLSGTDRIGIAGTNNTNLRQYRAYHGAGTLNSSRSTNFSSAHRYRLEWRSGKIEHFADDVSEASTTNSDYIPTASLPLDILVYYGGANQYVYLYYIWVLNHAADDPVPSPGEWVEVGSVPEGSLIGGKLLRGGVLLHGVLGRS